MIVEETQEESLDNSISYRGQNIIVVGGGSPGRTSIINRILDGSWEEAYEITIGIDFMSKIIKFRGQNIEIRIYDSSGVEKSMGLIACYIRDVSIVFIVYEVSYRYSFENIKTWISFIKKFEVKIVVLVGNKIDLEGREVETKEGEELAKKEGLLFFECSAKTNVNIMNMFYSSLTRLPIFGINNESERNNIVRELIEENELGDFKEDKRNQDLIVRKEDKISRDVKFPRKKKKCCKCQII